MTSQSVKFTVCEGFFRDVLFNYANYNMKFSVCQHYPPIILSINLKFVDVNKCNIVIL